MFSKNNKTFYLIFLFVVLTVHTFILTSVLSVSKEPVKQVNANHLLNKDTLAIKKIRLTPSPSQIPHLNNAFIINAGGN